MSEPRPPSFIPLNFKLTFEERLRAFAGLPAFIRRRKNLEIVRDRFWVRARELRATWSVSPEGSWTEVVHELDYDEVNSLIEGYNECYPIEADLPSDPLTGDYLQGAEVWQPEESITPEAVLARFPDPELSSR